MVRTFRSTVLPLMIMALLSIMPAGGAARGPVAGQPAGSLEYSWTQFNGDAAHSGNNVAESTISSATVAALQPIPGFPMTLPSPADGTPVYLPRVDTGSGVKALLFVTTQDGHLLAIDARLGTVVWSKQHPAGSCKINGGTSTCYTTSSPAIDPNGLYVYSYGLDGYVHKHQVRDGTEITGGRWPELATRKPFDEKGSSALSIATTAGGSSYLYVTNGGYPGDAGNYQGHVTSINLADGSQHVFNAACSNQVDVHFVEPPSTPSCQSVQNAIWARAGVVYDSATNKLYMATGNGNFSPTNFNWGDTVLALRPDGTSNAGVPLDSYTPANFQQLQDTDADLGSTAPAILPAPAGSTVRHLGLQGGKDQKLRLLNLDNLSGQGGPGHTGGEVPGSIIPVPQGGVVLTAPAVWTNPRDGSTWAFVANSNGISALQVTTDGAGIPRLQVKWNAATGGSESSALVANNIVYRATDNLIEARDPLTAAVLWSAAGPGHIHWNSPVVVGGGLYLSDDNGHLFGFAVNGKLPAFKELFVPYVTR